LHERSPVNTNTEATVARALSCSLFRNVIEDRVVGNSTSREQRAWPDERQEESKIVRFGNATKSDSPRTAPFE
jgi:hypothetical protein